MRRTSLLLGLAALAVLAACGGDDDGNSPEPVANEILVENNRFDPSSLTVSPGTTVTFRWPSGSAGHNVSPWGGNTAAIPASPGTPTLRSGPFEFGVAFPEAGTFRFFCTAHGSISGGGSPSGMAGTITVE